MDLSYFSHKSIYECLLLTSETLGAEKEEVMEKLEYHYPHVKKYVQEYEDRLNHPSRHLEYLSGPDTFIYFRNIAGRRILLLGEHHHSKFLCSPNILKKKGTYEINSYLIDLCKNADSCVDVLTETPYKYSFQLKNCTKNTSLQQYPNPLYAVTCELERLKKTGNLPPYMRYHNVDLRRYKNTIFPGMKLHESLIENMAVTNDKKYTKIKSYYEKNKNMVLKYLLSIDKSVQARSEYHRILSELLGLFGQDLDVEKNIELENDYFSLIKKEMGKIDPIINKDKVLNTLLDIYSQENMYTAIMVIPMDLYLLLRLFVVFDENKMERSTGCKHSKNVKNAIVYTGAAHTRFYELFFEKYFEVKADVVIKNKKQCIKVHDFDFFSEK